MYEALCDYVKEKKPSWVIGSPPCTAFSRLQGLNFPKMDPAKVARMIKEAKMHLHFVTSLYQRQLSQNRHFLHEHPAGARSWHHPSILAIRQMEGVGVVRGDQCMFGLTTKGASADEKRLAKKPTKFMSSSPHMLKQLEKKCDRSHSHQILEGARCADAAFYPLQLVRTLLRGIRDTKAAESKKIQLMKSLIPDGEVDESEDRVLAVADTTGAARVHVTKVGGGHIQLDWDERNFKELYRDEYTGEILPRHLIQEAIKEELSYSNAHVWEVMDKEGLKKFKDAKLVRCRWVLCNKGDAQNPDVGARLVACEVNHDGSKEES